MQCRGSIREQDRSSGCAPLVRLRRSFDQLGLRGQLRRHHDPSWRCLQHSALDNIAITTTAAVPEPSSLALLGLALFGLGWRSRSRHRPAG
ncbi:MAG: PEP-CTERM sorting domain-containing protein [Acidobacteria bacterium]|nr:PEP-CTERM sorting domain-containing protein [Acidobacteriota bacterium]